MGGGVGGRTRLVSEAGRLRGDDEAARRNEAGERHGEGADVGAGVEHHRPRPHQPREEPHLPPPSRQLAAAAAKAEAEAEAAAAEAAACCR